MASIDQQWSHVIKLRYQQMWITSYERIHLLYKILIYLGTEITEAINSVLLVLEYTHNYNIIELLQRNRRCFPTIKK